MARIVRAALIQTEGLSPREAMVEHQVGLVRRAAAEGAQVTCLQELATGPYFCQEEDRRWYDLAEPVPDGPTIQRMQEVARETGMVLIVPVYE
ncbi:MAG: acyltransferase, partial [Chloroflexi bacterium]|nr:acyltransferase [Chloroflexota bacterium]